MSVYQKLSDAREEFHKLELKKSGHNKFANYYYFELADFLIPALEVFKKHNLLGVVSFTPDQASLTIIDLEDSNSCIGITSPMSTAALKGCHEVQNLGAVQTYLRRYLWVAALEIVEHDAIDSSPKLPAKGDIRGTAKGIPALGHIGDHLSADWKAYLEDTAKACDALVAAGDVAGAVREKYAEPMDDEAMVLYMESKMDSKTKTAMRNFEGNK